MQKKEQDKISEKVFNETEISGLPERVRKEQFQELTELLRKMDEHSENCNKR